MQRNNIILSALLLNISIVISGTAAAATNGIASGSIFGIQIGQILEMSPEEIKDAARTDGSFVRKKADKPSDIQFLQVYVTPITHTVTGVDGASEVRTKQQADAFVSKYTDVLSGLSNSFVRRKDTATGLFQPSGRRSRCSILKIHMLSYRAGPDPVALSGRRE